MPLGAARASDAPAPLPRVAAHPPPLPPHSPTHPPRAPYLEAGPSWWQTLEDNGFSWDSTQTCVARAWGQRHTHAARLQRLLLEHHAPPQAPPAPRASTFAPPPPPPPGAHHSEYWGDGGAPSASKRGWPYKLSSGFKLDCGWVGGLDCRGSYNLWEVVLPTLQKGADCSGGCDGPMDPRKYSDLK